jgi:hypothetical protein
MQGSLVRHPAIHKSAHLRARRTSANNRPPPPPSHAQPRTVSPVVSAQHIYSILPPTPTPSHLPPAPLTMSPVMSAQHIHLRVFFCSCLAACRCVTPACTYSTDLATCGQGEKEMGINKAYIITTGAWPPTCSTAACTPPPWPPAGKGTRQTRHQYNHKHVHPTPQHPEQGSTERQASQATRATHALTAAHHPREPSNLSIIPSPSLQPKPTKHGPQTHTK